MRKNALVILSILTISMMILPVSAAKKMEYKANGKVTEYDNLQMYPDVPPSASVLGGQWSMSVKDGNVDFKLTYREENLISEPEFGAPVGSVDHFIITFEKADIIGNPPFSIDDEGTWVITGDFNIDKLAVQPDGSEVWMYGLVSPQGGAVHIYPGGGMALDVGPWHLKGSITSLK